MATRGADVHRDLLTHAHIYYIFLYLYNLNSLDSLDSLLYIVFKPYTAYRTQPLAMDAMAMEARERRAAVEAFTRLEPRARPPGPAPRSLRLPRHTARRVRIEAPEAKRAAPCDAAQRALLEAVTAICAGQSPGQT